MPQPWPAVSLSLAEAGMAGSVSPCPKLVNSSSRGGFCVTFEWLKSLYSVLNENNFQFGHTVYRCLALTNIVT